MALSLKTISVGSETGVQDIQSNFTTIKSAVDALQVAAPTIQKILVSQCTPLNSATGFNSNAAVWLLTYQTYQIFVYDLWFNGVTINPWQSKGILSVPKSYFKHPKMINITNLPIEICNYSDGTILGTEFHPDTGIIECRSASNAGSGAGHSRRVMGSFLIHD